VVALHADIGGGLSSADWAAIRFTVSQAIVSALVSVGLAIPTARALARRQFRGRGLLITLLGTPFLLPVIVAIIGLLAVFGRSGVLNDLFAFFNIPAISIYGFHGVVLAHVFFNLPLATRLLLQGWLSVPSERFRLAATLNVPVARLILLGCIQFLICAAAALIAWKVTLPDQFGKGLDRAVQRWDRASGWDYFWLIGVAAFLLIPLGLIVLRGLPALLDLPAQVWPAAVRSVGVAIVASALSVSMAIALAVRGGAVVSAIGMLPLAASSLVIGTGLFLAIFPFVAPSSLALPVTTLVNAIFALPFVLRIISPAVETAGASYGPLADSLGMQGWARMRLVILPRIKPQVGFAAGLAAALAMGDLGVIALLDLRPRRATRC